MATAERPPQLYKDFHISGHKILWYMSMGTILTTMAFVGVKEIQRITEGLPEANPVPMTQPLTDTEIQEALKNSGYCAWDLMSEHDVIAPPPPPSSDKHFGCIPIVKR